jgi:IS66 C-terminal element/Transposase IS66 family
LSRWDALSRYLADGRLSIDNNLAERLLRGIAVSRKNFLFLGSDRGGERAAAIYTLIESAKLNGLNPEAYLTAVLDRMARGHPINRLDELLPWNFQSGAFRHFLGVNEELLFDKVPSARARSMMLPAHLRGSPRGCRKSVRQQNA